MTMYLNKKEYELIFNLQKYSVIIYNIISVI